MDIDRKAIVWLFTIAGSLAINVNVSALAGEIYKSIDQFGQVTYSAMPRGDAVSVKKLVLPHQPTPEEIIAAEEQNELMKAIGAELEKNRKQREVDQARKTAVEYPQQNIGRITIVFIPVPIFVSPVHSVTHFKKRLKPQSQM